ncbi:helix-turn-helix domain-containing protein [Bradyrhizobium ottawaense]|uniref:helix-turn-helix domain-containing protein n=2 Tax=Bradyrhizobium ottawaense TaxID=931866 RepID=UPI0030C671C0
MPNNQLMSPRQVTLELGVVYQTVLHWVHRGKLRPVARTMGGHARFDRADVEAIKTKGKCPPSATIVPPPEESPASAEMHADSSLAVAGPDRDETKAISSEIERAELAAAYGRGLIEHLDKLRDEAVQRATGVGSCEIFFLIWNAPFEQAAKRLGLEKHVLMRICKLYAIPTPPPGYWQTSIARRPFRVTRLQAMSDDK